MTLRPLALLALSAPSFCRGWIIGTIQGYAVALLLALSPSTVHAAKVSFTVPRWSAADSTGTPLEGLPAMVKQVQLEFSLDGGPWIPYWGGPLNLVRAGIWDGKKIGWATMPERLYLRTLGWRAASADSAGNWSPWAYATRTKP